MKLALLLVTPVLGIHLVTQSDAKCEDGIRSEYIGTNVVCIPKFCRESGTLESRPTCQHAYTPDAKDEHNWGQKTTEQCCVDEVKKRVCGQDGAPAACYKPCTSRSAPCSLGDVQEYTAPPASSANDDCGKAKTDMHDSLKSAVSGADGSGGDQWGKLQNRAADSK